MLLAANRCEPTCGKAPSPSLPLADRVIGNLQQWLLGTHHGVSREQLQVYLDESVFRHNRRKTPTAAFQTLLGLGARRKPTVYEQYAIQPTLVSHHTRANHNLLGFAETTRISRS